MDGYCAIGVNLDDAKGTFLWVEFTSDVVGRDVDGVADGIIVGLAACVFAEVVAEGVLAAALIDDSPISQVGGVDDHVTAKGYLSRCSHEGSVVGAPESPCDGLEDAVGGGVVVGTGR